MAIKQLKVIEQELPVSVVMYIKSNKTSFKQWLLIEAAYIEEAGIWKT
jgi:aspartate carbamoyltransferase regulatory subunit